MQAFSSCDAWASHGGGFSCCSAPALGDVGLRSCFLLQIPDELHSKNSPPQEIVESFLTSQKWHCRPHPHMPSLPEASVVSCQEPQVCLLRQLNSLAESAQDLKFHLVSFVKRVLSLPGADSQQSTALLIVRREA